MLAKVPNAQAASQVISQQVASRLGQQHLTPVAGAHDPRATVHVDADVSPVVESCLAGVDAHPHP